MYSALVWTSGNCLFQNYSCIEYLRRIPYLKIIGMTTTENYDFFDYIDGIPFINIEEIKFMFFDIVIIFENDYTFYKKVRDVFLKIGFCDEQIINYTVVKRYGFDLEKYLIIKKNPPTIISPNCWAGITYNFLQLEFKSPTINMFFSPDKPEEYITFVNNLEYYLSIDLKFEKMGFEKNLNHDYPICKCDDITLHFNHYLDFKDAEKSWNRRRLRVNFDNIFVMYFCENDNLLNKFLQIPYNKICFVSYKSPMINQNKNIFYVNYKDNKLLKETPFWNIIINMAKGDFLFYNIFDVLTEKAYSSVSRFKNN